MTRKSAEICKTSKQADLGADIFWSVVESRQERLNRQRVQAISPRNRTGLAEDYGRGAKCIERAEKLVDFPKSMLKAAMHL